MKMFEEFMQADYELDQIIKKVQDRIKYWFQDGSFSISSTLVDQSKSSTPNAAKRSIICNFADAEFYYQLIIRFYIEDLENCDVFIKKYDPNKIDEPNGGEPVWTIELSNDKQVKIDDVKEDFVIQEISKMDDDHKENPDENKIGVPKEKEAQPAPGGAPGAQGAPGGMPPPPGGEAPPAQAAAPFPQPGGGATQETPVF
jgi:hypothetical protein